MSNVKRLGIIVALFLTVILSASSASAEEIKKIFVIAMENHNWEQPANKFTGGIQQIFQTGSPVHQQPGWRQCLCRGEWPCDQHQ